MYNCNKRSTFILVAALLVSCLITSIGSVAAQNIDLTYAGTENSHDPPSIVFSVSDNSTIYTDSKNLYLECTVYLPSYNFISFGASLYSVSYKASWQNSPLTVYSWSYHNPANLKDDDPNPQQRFTYKVDLTDAPVGTHQVTVTATGGVYSTNLTTYTILTSTDTSTLNFNKANRQPTTPQPTPIAQSGILWATNLPWNLADTPARDMWSSEISTKTRSWTTPVIVDSVMYAGATSEVHGVGNGRWMGPSKAWINVYAFNASNGRQIWSYQATYNSMTDLAVSGGKVFFGARPEYDSKGETESSLFALNAANGALLWKTQCPYVYGVPVVDEGKVFGDSDHSILAFDENNGGILWNFTTNDFVGSTPTTANNILYVSSNDHTLYALNMTDGREAWTIKNDPLGFSSATAANDVVYVPSDDGNIYALNAATGAELWRHSTTEFSWANYTSHSTPICKSGVLYFTSHSGQHIHIQGADSGDVCYMDDRYSVSALDQSGTKIWNYTITAAGSAGYGSSVSVADGIIYAANWQDLVGFNSQTGAFIWNYTLGDLYPQTQPVAANSALYVGFSDGQIYALKPTELGLNTENPAATGDQTVNPTFIIAILITPIIAVAALVFWIRNKPSQVIKQTC
jgi:outer membrane protein assembly factor BamB